MIKFFSFLRFPLFSFFHRKFIQSISNSALFIIKEIISKQINKNANKIKITETQPVENSYLLLCIQFNILHYPYII